jgi:uncharacterized RDD family membrane protein YckC
MDAFAFLSILAAIGFVIWLIYRGGSLEPMKSITEKPSSQMNRKSSKRSEAGYGTEQGEVSSGGTTLSPAARSSRLGAAVIDLLAGALAVLPGAIISASAGYSDGQLALGGFLFIAGGLGMAGYQIHLLVQRGQSVGKKAVGIRIVDHNSGQIPHWGRLVFVRQGVPGLVSAIPYVGWLLVLIDILFITRNDRRCLHDHLAGTIVCTGHPSRNMSRGRARTTGDEKESASDLRLEKTGAADHPARTDESGPSSVAGAATPREGGSDASSASDGPVTGEREAEPLSEEEREKVQRFAYQLQRLRTLRDRSVLSEVEHRRARREAIAEVEKMMAIKNITRGILVDMVEAMEERGQVAAGDVALVREELP